MDMSKLPRMSQSPAPPPQVQPQHEYRVQPPLDSPYAGGSAEAWISIAIGVILFFATYAQRLVQYLLSRDSFTWTFRDETGAPLAYSETVFIWGDAAMLLFCTVLIFEGIVLFIRKPTLIAIAFGVTVITDGALQCDRVLAGVHHVADVVQRHVHF